MEEKRYLPIGSVVKLEGGEKRVMIYGRRQKQLNSEVIWDYIACLYPEGNISEEYMYLFNNEQIEVVYGIGFQDEEEFAFQRRLVEIGKTNQIPTQN
jgi:hypothetical protein